MEVAELEPNRQKVKVIAEIGCNHMGNIDIALEMIRVAAKVGGADIVKFQKRSNRELLSAEEFDRPHPVPSNSFGASYGLHREFLELSVDHHKQLQQECFASGVEYSTSVWDLTSARQVAALAPAMIKIPSATNLNFALLEHLCLHYSGEIHISTGMTTKSEIGEVVDFMKSYGRAKDMVIYACTSGYPVEFRDICLLEIESLMQQYGQVVKGIGFSGHHLGIAVDSAALAIGRMCEERGMGRFTHIERHFTLDRTWKGTDHAASLEPDGLRKLCRDIRNVDLAITHKAKEVLPVEQVQRDKLKRAAERVSKAA